MKKKKYFFFSSFSLYILLKIFILLGGTILIFMHNLITGIRFKATYNNKLINSNYFYFPYIRYIEKIIYNFFLTELINLPNFSTSGNNIGKFKLEYKLNLKIYIILFAF